MILQILHYTNFHIKVSLNDAKFNIEIFINDTKFNIILCLCTYVTNCTNF